MDEKPLIFVSCGQYTEQEKQLGKDICSLVEQLRPDVTAYFAEYQTTVEGLSDHILKTLHCAAGLICVMHERGKVLTAAGREHTRGSVWVEQEIAITAFMSHVLNRSIPTLFYKQAGVGIEGIRSVLLMNPRLEFDEESQILQDLRSELPKMVFTPFRSYDIEPVLKHREIPGGSSGDRRWYRLDCNVRNSGTEQVTDFELRVFFPRKFLDPPHQGDRTRSTETHECFILCAKDRAPSALYPGDNLANPLMINYFVDHDLRHDAKAMQSEICVKLFSGSMAAKKAAFRISDFQKFLSGQTIRRFCV